jgi:tRNA uridine 5-carbamoylmethylation protein Kti12
MNIFEDLEKYDVIILSGIPGSGKSYLARKKMKFRQICSADDSMYEDGVYKFSPEKLGPAHKACMCKFLDALKEEKCVIVDNTNIEAWEISPYLSVAEAKGFSVCILQINCDPEIATERNQHFVPARTINRMANRLANRHLPPFWKVITVDN